MAHFGVYFCKLFFPPPFLFCLSSLGYSKVPCLDLNRKRFFPFFTTQSNWVVRRFVLVITRKQKANHRVLLAEQTCVFLVPIDASAAIFIFYVKSRRSFVENKKLEFLFYSNVTSFWYNLFWFPFPLDSFFLNLSPRKQQQKLSNSITKRPLSFPHFIGTFFQLVTTVWA